MKKLVVAASLGSVILAGCGGGSGGTAGDATEAQGQLRLSITDAPVDTAEAVVVTFNSASLYPAADGEPILFKFDAPKQIDLLQLQGSQSASLVDASIEAGEYSEIRLEIEAVATSCQSPVAPYPSYIQFDSGTYPLAVPSSTLKIKGPVTVAADQSVAYTIDFDLRKSIAARNKDCYNLKPVVKLTDDSETGSLMGAISSTLMSSGCTSDGAAAVYLYAGSDATVDDLGSADEPSYTALVQNDNGDYSYEFGFLPAADYTVAFTCQSSVDDAAVDDAISFSAINNVSVEAAKSTLQDLD